MKQIKQLIFCMSIFLLPMSIFGANCGGDIPCNCGDRVVNDYVMQDDLICNNNGLIIADEVKIDCNNHKVIGNNTGWAFKTQDKRYLSFSMTNCNIQNFKYGVYFNYYKKRQCIGCPYMYYYPDYSNIYDNKFINNEYGILSRGNYNEIFNNVFENNNYGVYNTKGKKSQFYGNSFIDNDEYGIYNNAENMIIWNNTFDKTGIYQKYTRRNRFCKNGIENIYLGELKGHTCDCIIPQSDMVVNSAVKLCKDDYFVEGLTLERGVVFDCQGAHIYGNQTGSGVLIKGSDRTTIKNCEISNYSKGIFYTYQIDKYNNKDSSVYNKVLNNTIYDVDVGIDMNYATYGYGSSGVAYSKSRAEEVHNNTIVANEYNINVRHDDLINATYNWFGTNESDFIESKLNGNILYQPYVLNGPIADLTIYQNDIKYLDDKVFVNVKNEGDLYALPFEIKVIESNNGVYENEVIYQTNRGIAPHGEKLFEISLDFQEDSQIHVILDDKNEILELDELNNYASIRDSKFMKYYLDIELKEEVVKNEIKNYIKDMIGKELFVNSKEDAEVIIEIKEDFSPLDYYEYSYYDLEEKAPYETKVESKIDDKIKISIDAENTEGFIMGAKKMIKHMDELISQENIIRVNKINIEALGMYDYLNFNYTGYIAEMFSVKNALYNNMFSQKTDTIEINSPNGIMNYRYKKLNSLKSDMIKNYIDSDGYPIIIGRGLWSNLNTWEELGSELANEGYDVYLIELTGGPQSECDSCYNYPYEFLTDKVYPSYINFVLEDSGKEKVKYVGFSNGARTALDSLSESKVDPDKVDVLVLAGVPGAFEELSYFGKTIKKSGGVAINRLEEKNITHVTFSRVAHELDSVLGEILSFGKSYQRNKISSRLFKQYYEWISNSEDKQPGEGLNVNYFTLIYGDDGFGLSRTNDRIVSVFDEKEIYYNVNNNSGIKKLFEFYLNHNNMADEIITKDIIKQSISKEVFN